MAIKKIAIKGTAVKSAAALSTKLKAVKKTTTVKPKTVKSKKVKPMAQNTNATGSGATNTVDPSKSFLEEVYILENPDNKKALPSYKALAAVSDMTLGPDANGFLKAQFSIIHFTKNSKEEYREHIHTVGGDVILNATLDGVTRQIHSIPSRAALYFVNEMCKMFEMDWNAILFEECIIEVSNGELYSISKTGANPIIIKDLISNTAAVAKQIENLYITPELGKLRDLITELKDEVKVLEKDSGITGNVDLANLKNLITQAGLALRLAEKSTSEPAMMADAVK